MTLPNPLGLQRKMVLAEISSVVLGALSLKHTSSLAQRTVFYHFPSLKTVRRCLSYYLFVDL